MAIQQLWLEGKRDEAAQRVPDAMVTQFQALGDKATVSQRLRSYRDAGVTTLKLGLDSAGPIGPARYELLEQIVDITEPSNEAIHGATCPKPHEGHALHRRA